MDGLLVYKVGPLICYRNVLAHTGHVLWQYREVADSHGVLQQPLKADRPAGHSPLSVAPVALHAGQTGITVQAVVAAAPLQLHAVEFCLRARTHKETNHIFFFQRQQV